MERSLAGSAAPFAAFVAITQTAGGTGQNPKGPKRQRRMAEAGYFASRCKARGWIANVSSHRQRAAENSRAQPLPARAACRSTALQKAKVASPSGIGLAETDLLTPIKAARLLRGYRHRMQEADDVLRSELKPQRRSEGLEAEDVQIFVEIS